MMLFKIKRFLYRLWYKKPINLDKHESWWKYLKKNWQKDNLFPPPIEPELAFCYLSDYLLDIKTTPEEIDIYNVADKILDKYVKEKVKIDEDIQPYGILNKLFEVMLPGQYIIDPLPQSQCNTEIVSGILQEYSDDYNEEYEYYRKDN